MDIMDTPHTPHTTHTMDDSGYYSASDGIDEETNLPRDHSRMRVALVCPVQIRPHVGYEYLVITIVPLVEWYTMNPDLYMLIDHSLEIHLVKTYMTPRDELMATLHTHRLIRIQRRWKRIYARRKEHARKRTNPLTFDKHMRYGIHPCGGGGV